MRKPTQRADEADATCPNNGVTLEELVERLRGDEYELEGRGDEARANPAGVPKLDVEHVAEDTD
eukprot:3310348-Alexandrium_andersonii.AAC.1